MKQINPQQEKAILDLAQKYNIGVQDYVALQTMLEKLPVVEEKEEKKK